MQDGRHAVAPGAGWDRRIGPDRRKPHLLSDWRYAFGGRRRGIRRETDALYGGVDIYSGRVMALTVGICILNALDAAFTLILVQAGVAEEWNPLMRALLENDVQLFVNLKIAITSSALLFLIVCSSTRVLRGIKVERLLYGVLCAYMCVVCYHLMLLQTAASE
jgi:hypothetical protein